MPPSIPDAPPRIFTAAQISSKMTRFVAPPAAPTFRGCGTHSGPSARLHIAQPTGTAAESPAFRVTVCRRRKKGRNREGEKKRTRASPAADDQKLAASIPASAREISRRSRNVPARLRPDAGRGSRRVLRLSRTLHCPPQLRPRHHRCRPRDCRRAPVLRTRTSCSPHIVGPPSIPASSRREISDRPSGSARIPDRFVGQEMPSPSPPRHRGSLCSASRKTLTSKHWGKFRRGNPRQTKFVRPCPPGETRLSIAPRGLDRPQSALVPLDAPPP